jgi:hypothetical protein
MSEILDKINDFLDDDDLLERMIDFLSIIDLDSLSEEQIQKVDKIIDLMEQDEILNERTKRVVRGGKIIRRKVCPKGRKVVNNMCVKITSIEKRKRSKGAKRGNRKKRSQQAAINRKRKKSLRRRRSI